MERAWKDNSNYTKDPKLPKINVQGFRNKATYCAFSKWKCLK